MKVAVVASLQRDISHTSTGGTEAFAHILTEGLVQDGVDVTLFATSDSETSATLQSICDSHQTKGVHEGPVAVNVPYEILQARNVIKQSKNFDIIHNNYWFYYSLTGFSEFSDCPIITTIHNNYWHYPSLKEALVKTHRKGKDIVVFLSKGAQELAGDAVDSVVINNGIDISQFPFSAEAHGNILWFSRLVQEKGIIPAIEASQLGNFSLDVAGTMPIGPKNKAFVQSQVLPLFKDTVHYLGEPSEEERVRLYQNTPALLFPTLMEEQFPLVLLEAMACGTPVIAYNRGAISEEIVDGVTGFVIDPDDEDRPGKGTWVIKQQGPAGLVEAVRRVGEIDRAACRKHVETHFSREQMIKKYIEVYKKALHV